MVATIERSAHLIGNYLEHALAGLRLTQAEAHVLAQLARRGPMSIGALHREIARKRSTLTNVLDRLERRGFIRRELNRADRRSFLVHLTDAGTSAASHVTEAVDALEAQVLAAVNSRDLHGLDAVADALTAATGHRSP